MRYTFEILFDFIDETIAFLQNNIRNFAKALSIMLPFAMFTVGLFADKMNSTGTTIALVIIVPALMWIISGYLNSLANKLGKGSNVPVPVKRFTSVDEDGEVSVERNREHELILYMAELENWIQRKGIR